MSLQQLREKIVTEIPISELISRYGIHLTRKSTGHVGVCPFHNDSHPSMSVSDDKRIYKCFACGAGTTHFDFVMNLHSLSFVEALKDICEKFGIDFDSYTNKREKSQKEVYAEKILKSASEIYHQIGMKNMPEPFADFLKNRDIAMEIATTYKLGFAPKKNTILDYINTLPKNAQQDVTQVALETGLVKRDDKTGNLYDTFRDRIMFPIWDHFGKVIGFTSRAIHDYQKAKYMNSKESFIFNKRNLLYGLHLAKPFIRKRDSVLLVEGNMDQVALFKKGFENAVAIQGTALGDHSLRTLKSLTQNIVLSLDTDNAGFDAAVRTNKQFLENGIIPKYIEFSPHKDPDDFLKEEGAVALQKKIDEARPFIDIQFESICPSAPIELLDKKLELLEQSFEILAPLGNSLKATERVIRWADLLGLKSNSDQILKNYESFLKGHKSPSPQVQTPIQEVPEEVNFIHSPDAIDMPKEEDKITKVEETLLVTLIEHPECLEYDEMSELLDFMDSDGVKEYILKLRELIFEIDSKEFFNFAQSEAQKYKIEDIVARGIKRNKSIALDKTRAKKIIVDLEKKLIKEKLKQKRSELKEKRTMLETDQELDSLMTEIHEIERKLLTLKL